MSRSPAGASLVRSNSASHFITDRPPAPGDRDGDVVPLVYPTPDSRPRPPESRPPDSRLDGAARALRRSTSSRRRTAPGDARSSSPYAKPDKDAAVSGPNFGARPDGGAAVPGPGFGARHDDGAARPGPSLDAKSDEDAASPLRSPAPVPTDEAGPARVPPPRRRPDQAPVLETQASASDVPGAAASAEEDSNEWWRNTETSARDRSRRARSRRRSPDSASDEDAAASPAEAVPPGNSDAESSGRHTVPDELVQAATYRLPPDRVFRAKVRQLTVEDQIEEATVRLPEPPIPQPRTSAPPE